MNDAFDALSRYCPKLGHDVPFRYCRMPGAELPCRGLVGCWQRSMDVQAFLAEHYPPEQIQRLSAPPADRLCTLVELIERARRSAQGGGEP